MPADGDLYNRDFYAWIRTQAHAVRAAASGGNLPIDWDNLAEELDALGRSERREVSSCIDMIVEHLLKLSVPPAQAPRCGWIETVQRTRRDLERVLEDSPSLRPEVPAMIERIGPGLARLVAANLRDAGEATAPALARLHAMTFAPEQVLGDRLPDPPA